MIIFENKNTCCVYVIWEHNIITSISCLKRLFSYCQHSFHFFARFSIIPVNVQKIKYFFVNSQDLTDFSLILPNLLPFSVYFHLLLFHSVNQNIFQKVQIIILEGRAKLWLRRKIRQKVSNIDRGICPGLCRG